MMIVSCGQCWGSPSGCGVAGGVRIQSSRYPISQTLKGSGLRVLGRASSSWFTGIES